jgi:hypothetical protein
MGKTVCLASAATSKESLMFDPEKFTIETVNVGDRKLAYRAYENNVYVTNPVDAPYQSLNLYVPLEYYQGQSIIGGYMPGKPGSPKPSDRMGDSGLRSRTPTPAPERSDPQSAPNAIAVALARGFVVAAPGARGRTSKNETGGNIGKAPAAIVDLKAAVRYLRHNDKLMPGDAEKIISNGTSAGGALSALLGATGNNADYAADLKAIGAAEERDDIFAASCYCPITNLEHADAAYEWLFTGIAAYEGRGDSGTLSAEQVQLSNELKSLFPPYLNSLGLKTDDTPLTLDSSGKGSFKEYVKSLVIVSAQKAIDGGKDLFSFPWVTQKDGAISDIDFDKFIAFATRMKTPPAFDSLELNTPENSLFGSTAIDSRHFTTFAAEHSANHTIADTSVVTMMSPMNYIGSEGTTTAKHWRIRHGAVDRDTSLAIPVILATKLQNRGFEVDFAMPWGQGHGGDYDLDELFAWMDLICR